METGSRNSGRDGGDSDTDEAGDTWMSTGGNAVFGVVLKPRSTNAHLISGLSRHPSAREGRKGSKRAQ